MMRKNTKPLVMTFFIGLTLTVNRVEAASLNGEFQLAQLPMQQQTNDPHLQKMLDASVADATLTWKVPQGWNETKGSGMRMATFKSQKEDGMECSVIALKGMAGGIEGNILRWINQIGLDIPGDKFATFMQDLEIIEIRDDVSAYYINLSLLQDPGDTAGDSMIASILQLPTETVFFKMTGSLGAVRQNEDQFRALITSLSVGPQ